MPEAVAETDTLAAIPEPTKPMQEPFRNSMDIEDPMKQAQAIADETDEAILALLQAANVEKR